jgi:DNA-binding NtrC family response regulator
MARKRSYITALSNLLAECAQPVYVLDAAGKLVYCNPACTSWLNVDAHQLLGRVCQYRSQPAETEPADLSFALCPPPQAFLGQRLSACVVRHPQAGLTEVREIDCVPLGQPPQKCLGVLILVGPVVEDSRPAGQPSQAVELHGQLRQMLADYDRRWPLNQILGHSPAMTRVRQQMLLATDSEARVVIAGPPGSGREYVARSIHYSRSASASALAPLACGLLDAELLETTITSFVASSAELDLERPAALLLLEVDQLAVDAQAALMGILSIGEFHLRTLATARYPLTELARRGGFREDLAYALSTISIQIPPLVERPEDIPLLTQWFLERANAVSETQFSGFSEQALDRLVAYSWPGNADELALVVREACAQSQGPEIESDALLEVIRFAEQADALPPVEEESILLDAFLEDVEQELLRRAMQQTKGNRAAAARLLGISRARLLRRLDYFRID